MSDWPSDVRFKTETRDLDFNKENTMKQVTAKQIYKRWVAALRSGEYKQAVGALRDCEYGEFDYETEACVIDKVNGHCCLGVLQDLAAKDGGAQWNTIGGPQDDDGEPDKRIIDFLGMDGAMIAHLIEMNDDNDATFEEIADEIEFNIMPATGN